MAFAIMDGNFSSASTWDTGIVPTSTEDAYANGFTIQVDTSSTVKTLSNNVSDYYLPNTAIPKMTSTTSPSGEVFVSSQRPLYEAWKVFDRNPGTFWLCNFGVIVATLSYKFPTTKVIKRYSFKAGTDALNTPRDFIFDASNDALTWTTLDTQVGINVGSNGIFTSNILSNITSYLYYRISITANNGGLISSLGKFEMTESVSTDVGQKVNGIFVLSIPNTTLNIENLTNLLTTVLNVTATFGTNVLNILNGITNSSTSGTLINHSGNTNLTITTPFVNGGLVGNNSKCIVKTGNGVLSITGNVKGGGAFIAGVINNHAIESNNGDIFIFGIVFGPNYGNTSLSTAILQSVGNLTIVGNIIGDVKGSAVISTSTGYLNITGNVIAGSGSSAITKSSGNITVTGIIESREYQPITGLFNNLTIIGGVGSYPVASGLVSVIVITNSAIVEVIGYVSANAIAPAIVSPNLVKVSGAVYNNNRNVAIYAPKITIESTTTSWRFQTFAGPDIVLYASGSVALGQPAVNDVRFGTTYGATSEFTGVLKVPSPTQVLSGVPTDSTIGSLLLNPKDFWEYATSGVTVAGSFGQLIIDNIDAPISTSGGTTDLTPVLTAIALIPVNPLLETDVRVDAIVDDVNRIPDYPASVQSTGDQIATI